MRLKSHQSLRKQTDLETLAWNRSLYVLHDSVIHPEITMPHEFASLCLPIAQALILALDAEPQ